MHLIAVAVIFMAAMVYTSEASFCYDCESMDKECSSGNCSMRACLMVTIKGQGKKIYIKSCALGEASLKNFCVKNDTGIAAGLNNTKLGRTVDITQVETEACACYSNYCNKGGAAEIIPHGKGETTTSTGNQALLGKRTILSAICATCALRFF